MNKTKDKVITDPEYYNYFIIYLCHTNNIFILIKLIIIK